jgi:hypothetical protein
MKSSAVWIRFLTDSEIPAIRSKNRNKPVAVLAANYLSACFASNLAKRLKAWQQRGWRAEDSDSQRFFFILEIWSLFG